MAKLTSENNVKSSVLFACVTRRWVKVWREYEKQFNAAAKDATSHPRGYVPFRRYLFEIRSSIKKQLADECGITIDRGVELRPTHFGSQKVLGWRPTDAGSTRGTTYKPTYYDSAGDLLWQPVSSGPGRRLRWRLIELPEEPHLYWNVAGGLLHYTAFNIAITEAENLRKSAQSENHELLTGCIKKALSYILPAPKMLALLLGAQHPGVEAAALSALTGFVASQTSLRGNAGTRLRKALSSCGSQPNLNKLIDQLPAALRVAWEDCAGIPVVDAMDEAIDAAIGDLEGDGVRPHKEVSLYNASGPLPVESNLPTPEDFLLREEAHKEIQEAISKAALSEREREVLAMIRNNSRYKDIAQELGISENSVGVFVHRMKEKIRRAAGA